MAAGRRQARIFHAGHVGERELRHDLGPGMKRAIADDFADAVVEIDTGREREIDPVGT